MSKETKQEVAKAPATLAGILQSDRAKQEIANALPKHLSAERFTRVALTALTRTPKLKECTQPSFFKCLMDLSSMGLEPDGRRAHLIPFNNRRQGVVECQLIIDFKGLAELVRRNGDVSKIHADVIYSNDEFEYDLGEVNTHKPKFTDRGEPIGAYALVQFKDGAKQCELMSVEEIEAIRNQSNGKNSDPWVKHWNEMAKKTVFRRLTKWLTLSPEIMDSITKADDHEFKGMRDVTPSAEEVDRLSTSSPIDPGSIGNIGADEE